MIGKKGLSQVIGTVLMVLITLALIAGLWGPIQSFMTKNIDKAEACTGNFEKIVLNNEYTCYNSTSNETYVSIGMKDIDIDSLLIAVNYKDDSKLFRVENGSNTIDGVSNYFDRSATIQLPKKNSGKTYVVKGPGRPVIINIAPKIMDEQCDVIDKMEPVGIC